MISRSTLVGALVVAELAIVGMCVTAIAGGPISFYTPAPGPGNPLDPPARRSHGVSTVAKLDRTFTAGPAPHVLIDVRDVDVTVQTEEGVSVRLAETIRRSGFVRADLAPLTARQTLEGVRISSAAPTHYSLMLGCLTRTLAVVVPPGAHVEFTSAGRVDASGLRAKLSAHLAEGAVVVRDHRGDLDVSTGSGAIRMVDVQGSEIAASTRDGRVYLTRVAADRINANSAYGRIVGADVRAVDGALTTTDGRIILSFTRNSDAMVNAHTSDGHVRVSGFSTTESDDRHTVVQLGSGRGHFELSTGNGPITITQGASV